MANRLARNSGEKVRLEGRSTCWPKSSPSFTSATIHGSIVRWEMTLITSLFQRISVFSVPLSTPNLKYKETSEGNRGVKHHRHVLIHFIMWLTYVNQVCWQLILELYPSPASVQAAISFKNIISPTNTKVWQSLECFVSMYS